MPNCPHCAVAIESLTGFVPQATHEERLNTQKSAKDGEITALKGALSTAQGKASGFDAVVKERDGLQVEITKRDKRGVRLEALKSVGIKAELLEHVELLHNSATAGEDEPAEFGAWLEGDGKAHPLLASQFGQSTVDPASVDAAAAAAAAAAANTTPNLNGPNGNPEINGGTAPPAPPGAKMTETDLQTYFSSPEFTGMNAEDRGKKIIEMQGVVRAQDAVQA